MVSGIRSCILFYFTVMRQLKYFYLERWWNYRKNYPVSVPRLLVSDSCVYIAKGNLGISHTHDFRLLKLMQMNWFSGEVKIVLLISIMIFLNHYYLKKMKKYYPRTIFIFINTNSLNSWLIVINYCYYNYHSLWFCCGCCCY